MNSVDYRSSDFSLQGLWNVIKQPFKSSSSRVDSIPNLLRDLNALKNTPTDAYDAMTFMLPLPSPQYRNAVGRFLEKANSNEPTTVNSIQFGYTILDQIQNTIEQLEKLPDDEVNRLAVSMRFLVKNRFFEKADLEKYIEINHKSYRHNTTDFLKTHKIFEDDEGKFNKHRRNEKELPKIRTLVNSILESRLDVTSNNSSCSSSDPGDNDWTITLNTVDEDDLPTSDSSSSKTAILKAKTYQDSLINSNDSETSDSSSSRPASLTFGNIYLLKEINEISFSTTDAVFIDSAPRNFLI